MRCDDALEILGSTNIKKGGLQLMRYLTKNDLTVLASCPYLSRFEQVGGA